jgi:hypothetical protein
MRWTAVDNRSATARARALTADDEALKEYEQTQADDETQDQDADHHDDPAYQLLVGPRARRARVTSSQPITTRVLVAR